MIWTLLWATTSLVSSIAVVNESGSEMLSNDRRDSWGDLWGGE